MAENKPHTDGDLTAANTEDDVTVDGAAEVAQTASSSHLEAQQDKSDESIALQEQLLEDLDSQEPEGEALEGSPTKSDDYFEDDELALSRDEILSEDSSSVIAKQQEGVVSWEISGVYDENGKVRSKYALRNSPPLLQVRDSLGNQADFLLTKDLSGSLAKNFDDLHRAYYGIRPRSEMTTREKLGEIKSGLRDHMGKVIVVGGILLALIVFGIFY